jgi:hypothetical protein
MTRDQLEHAIRAACDVADDDEVWVFGSQAILGSFPNAPDALRGSIEVDVQPKNKPEATDRVDGALGELSPFHEAYGFYVHGVTIDSARLPAGWQERAVPVCDPVRTRGATGWCIEIHDLAASKLVAYREKDREFVRLLMIEEMIDVDTLVDRFRQMDLGFEVRNRMATWTMKTSEELSA